MKTIKIVLILLFLHGIFCFELKSQSLVEETIPTEYQTITKKVMVKPESYIEVDVPAEYGTVNKTVLARRGGCYVEWKEVSCKNYQEEGESPLANILAEKYQYPLSTIQLALKNKNYYKGEIDNIWGTQTEKALIAFKKDNQLAENTEIDDNTLKLLGIWREIIAN